MEKYIRADAALWPGVEELSDIVIAIFPSMLNLQEIGVGVVLIGESG
jgi:hypothetical protein